MSDLNFTQGDNQPSIFGTLAVNGTAVDLTGATVKFQMRLATDRRFLVDASAVIVNPAAGAVRYDLADGDMATAGECVARWQVTFPGGDVQHSEPENTITVEPA